HISGGIMAAYIAFGIRADLLLTAVIMTAPGTIMMAKMLVPETEVPKTMGTVRLEVAQTDVNVIDAAGRGTSEGLQLALNVGAMAPNRRHDLARLGLRAMFAGTLANFMTATIAGFLL